MDFKIHIDPDGTSAVYRQMCEQLKEQIVQNHVAVGTRMPSVDRIAAMANCSLQTADRALKALVKDGVCFRRPKKGTFVGTVSEPDAPGICGVWSSLGRRNLGRNLLIAHLVQGVMEAKENAKMDVSLLSEDPEETIRRYQASRSFRFCGLLVVDQEKFPRMLELARIFPDVRFILLNYCVESPENCPPNIGTVMNDNPLGAGLLIDYYARLGVRKIAVITQELLEGDFTYQQRVRGFVRAATKHSMQFDAGKDVIRCPYIQASIPQVGYQVAKKYLEAGNRPDVICTVNDYLALGVSQCIAEMGLSSQIRVSGYDMLNPDLVSQGKFDSVAVDYFSMSKTGIEFLQNETQSLPRRTMLPPKLVIYHPSK